MKNIILVGFMGTGKTETAKILARELGRKYVSIDDIIEKRENRSITDIFAACGEKYFRDLEKEIIREISLEIDQVIDAGGGAVLDSDNMKNLSENGKIICLWSDPEEIYRRVKSSGHRPLLEARDPLKRITELLEERRSFYEKADIHVDTTDMSIDDTVNKIKGILNGEKNI